MRKSRTEKRKRYVLRRLFWWALACLWCAMAVYLSRQTGEQTTQLGLFVTDLTEKVLVRLGAFVPERVFGVLERYLPQTLVTLLRGEHVKSVYLHMFLRKAAHVGVYLGLGFLLMRVYCRIMDLGIVSKGTDFIERIGLNSIWFLCLHAFEKFAIPWNGLSNLFPGRPILCFLICFVARLMLVMALFRLIMWARRLLRRKQMPKVTLTDA